MIYIWRWGRQCPNICQSLDLSEQWPAQQRRILLRIFLHILLLLQWALRWLEALGQYKVDGAARREGRVWGESSSGVTHSTHTVHTECTDCTPGQVLSQDIVCRLLTVQSVQNSGFSAAKVHKTSDAKWRNLLQEIKSWEVNRNGITDLDLLPMSSKHWKPGSWKFPQNTRKISPNTSETNSQTMR